MGLRNIYIYFFFITRRTCAIVFNLGEYRRIATATTTNFKNHNFFKQVSIFKNS